MKSYEMPNRLYIPQPFASKAGARKSTIDTLSSDNVNFEDGFPSVFATPPSQGGKLVDRGDMNAVGNIATHNQFFRMMGGIYTFDPDLAIKHGGYPRGAILEGLSGVNYYRVVSLIDDNMVDFTGNATQEQVNQGVIIGEVDNINWAYCEQGVVPDMSKIADLPNFSWQGESSFEDDCFPICTFYAPRNGVMGLEGNYTFSASKVEGSSVSSLGGFGLILCPGNTTPWNQNTPGSKPGQVFFSRGSWTTAKHTTTQIYYYSGDLTVANVTRGQMYGIYVMNVGGTVTDSNAKIVIR